MEKPTERLMHVLGFSRVRCFTCKKPVGIGEGLCDRTYDEMDVCYQEMKKDLEDPRLERELVETVFEMIEEHNK